MAENQNLGVLLEKANQLPRRPGVYIMRDKADKVIYVGKSRSMKDRVSQYFRANSSHDDKTRKMVSLVCEFEYILCDTEIESLALENSLIKQHSPRYNIKLKSARAYPYIKVAADDEFPKVEMTRKRVSDGAKYFGPYSSTSIVFDVIKTLEKTLGLPSCNRVFPRDIGKDRPCMYRQLGRCVAPCTGDVGSEEFRELIKCALAILRGNTREAVAELTNKMMKCAEEELYEEAARCRNSIDSLKKLSDKQKVVGSPDAEHDVIAFYHDDVCACASVFYIRSGAITDQEAVMFNADEMIGMRLYEEFVPDENGSETASKPDADVDIEGENADDIEQEARTSGFTTFITSLYQKREYIPKEILLSFKLPEKEIELISEYLRTLAGHKVTVRTPERGEMRELCAMARDNAKQNAENHKRKSESDTKMLTTLASLLKLEVVPERIEVYDISNLGSEQIHAGMIVSENSALKKSDYRVFKIKDLEQQDDYASMREAILRRFSHIDDEGSTYSIMPDLIFLDGGKGHVSVIRSALDEIGIDVPVFGMVKDEHHKTRSLVGIDEEISIAREQAVFMFVYKLQEEVHRFTVSKMDRAKRKTLKTSVLESVDGIGPAKARAVLAHFGTLAKLKEATADEIAKVKGISAKDAELIFQFFAGDVK